MNKRAKNIEKLSDWIEKGVMSVPQKAIEQALWIVKKANIQPDIFPTGKLSIQLEYEKKNGDYLEFECYENKIEWFKTINEVESEGASSYEDFEYNAMVEEFSPER